MADVVDQATRSRMMAGITGRNTRPELLLRRLLHRAGLRYRLHVRSLPGSPDIVFPARQAVIFVHGCFWHRHANCHWCSTPQTNRPFWQKKFEANTSRDDRHAAELLRSGWRVAIVWECAMKLAPEQTRHEIITWLSSDASRFETGLMRGRSTQ